MYSGLMNNKVERLNSSPMIVKLLCYLEKERYEPRKSRCSLSYTRCSVINSNRLSSKSKITHIVNSQIINRSMDKPSSTSLLSYNSNISDSSYHDKLCEIQHYSNLDTTSKDQTKPFGYQKNPTCQKMGINSYLPKYCMSFEKNISTKSLGLLSQDGSYVISEKDNSIATHSSLISDHNSENTLDITKKKIDATDRHVFPINKVRQRMNRNMTDFNKPLSIRTEIENWTFEVIQEYNAGTAAYVISSQIVNRIQNSLETDYINERAYIHNILVQKDFQLVQLREQNTILRNSIFEVENLKNSQNLANYDVYTLPLNLIISPQLNVLQEQKSDVNIGVSKCEIMNGNNQTVECQPKTFDIPDPPPNLPQSTNQHIPAPPPDMPIANKGKDAQSIFLFSYYQRKNNRNSYKMKPLHWKKLIFPNCKTKEKSIWKSLPKIKPKSFELLQFEECFSQKLFVKKRRFCEHKFSHPARVKECLPTELAKQLGIIFRRMESLDIEIEDLEAMLLSGDCNYTNINVSIFENLSRLVTNDSINIVKDYVVKYPNVVLTFEEKSLLRLGRISHVVLRIKHILFILNFDDEIKTIERNIAVIRTCCRKLMDSSEIRSLFAIILYFGNYMNRHYDSFKEATGFSIELLPRLKETKTRDNSSTLLEFVTRYYLLTVREGSKVSSLPFPDIEVLLIASNVNLEDLETSLKNLSKQLIQIRESTELSICKDSVDKESKLYLDQVLIFFQMAEEQVKDVNQQCSYCNEIYHEVLTYFYGAGNEAKDKIDNDRFFTIWSEFTLMFKEAILKEQSKLSIHNKLAIFKSETKIEPTSLNGLKIKVRSWKAKQK